MNLVWAGFFPILILSVTTLLHLSYAVSKPCNCVVFRFDDVQDYWLSKAQLSVMDMFLSENRSVTLGLIMNKIGNDSRIMNAINDGLDKGLFELAIHGWDHVRYPTLDDQEQKDSMLQANHKMQQLFGRTSGIIIPPENDYNYATLAAMKQLGLEIVSSANYVEEQFDNGQGIFSYDASKTHNNSKTDQSIFHLPTTISLVEYPVTGPIKNSIQNILANVTTNIDRYGYAVILIHPQDFVMANSNGTYSDVVNENQIQELSRLIDLISSKNINITSFSNIVEPEPITYRPTITRDLSSNKTLSSKGINITSFSNIVEPEPDVRSNYTCSKGWEISTYFTPTESDYGGKMLNISVNGTSRKIPSSFLDSVMKEGWGKAKEGYYIGYYDDDYHILFPYPLDSAGNPLRIGTITTDQSVIPKGSNVTVPTLPAPWNTRVFTSTDATSSNQGKMVGLYLGEGKQSEQEMSSIIGTDNTVCFK